MSRDFYDNPILNSPYAEPTRHWKLGEENQPTGEVINSRRESSFVTPVPPPRRGRDSGSQADLVDQTPEQIANEQQQYDTTANINEIRRYVDEWRKIPNPGDWGVTRTTRLLLEHWRSDKFDRERPFFCQVEAVETAIWLTEVAPKLGVDEERILNALREGSAAANPGLERLALKMATGSGKTTVMAMLIAWQTLNAAEHPQSSLFTRNFLVVTPGITIKNRLQVLQPKHPENYYELRQLVPPAMRDRLNSANIVITNYHAFLRRERMSLSTNLRSTLEGRNRGSMRTLESTGEMMRRAMPLLMDQRRGVMVLNDEGHHCYQRKPGEAEEGELTGEERAEAKSNEDAARVWLNGLRAIQSQVPIKHVYDLSATPFFLRGSGYAEGTLFPWTVSDFSLMDAIECGIVKLPRVPVEDDTVEDAPMYRNLWRNVGADVRKATRPAFSKLRPHMVPSLLQSAISSLYSHYEQVDAEWQRAGISVPPCFIIVCNNTKTSKIVYEWVSGRQIEGENGGGQSEFHEAACSLFSNFDDAGNPLARPNTILIDSQQLESGDALTRQFRTVAAAEIEAFREEVTKTRGQGAAEKISEAEILREVANSVGKPGRLGANIRCVVSVSMLTEGWDANTVTHILGVRAFGTQLLCEQVVGRALRRYAYDLEDDGMFEAQYADVFGVPFDFTAKPTIAPAKPPKPVTRVQAVRARDHLEITFPRVTGYHVRRDRRQRITASFTADSVSPFVGPIPDSVTVQGVAGQVTTMTGADVRGRRRQEVEYHIAKHLIAGYWGSYDVDHRNFIIVKSIISEWIDEYTLQHPSVPIGAFMMHEYTTRACDRIIAAIDRSSEESEARITASIDRFSPTGSTSNVDVNTSKDVYRTDPAKCHVNYVVQDSGWEGRMAQVLEQHPSVIAYAKNHGLGLEVPYTIGEERRSYLPDFIARVDVGGDAPLNVMIEVKGLRRPDVAEKSTAAADYWVRAVNNMGEYGRWAWAYCDDPELFSSELDAVIRENAAMGARG